MTKYIHTLSRVAATSQLQPLADTIRDSAGGYVFAVDDWTRLDRFLILGSEVGSYYASERALTLDNAQAVSRVIAADGERAVRRIVEISVSGRAPKNDAALFALALAASSEALAPRRLGRVAERGADGVASLPVLRLRARRARVGPGAPGRRRRLVSRAKGRSASLPAGEISPANRLVAP
jgi:hypothetical protein